MKNVVLQHIGLQFVVQFYSQIVRNYKSEKEKRNNFVVIV